MTTVVNNPTPGESGGNGVLVETIIIIGFLFVVLYFGIPAIKNMGPLQVNVPAPQVNVTVPTPEVNVQAPVPASTDPVQAPPVVVPSK